MSCRRCHGLMVLTTLDDVHSTLPGAGMSAWRCLLCGDVIDPAIEDNRKQRRQPTKSRARPPGGVMMQKPGPPRPRRALG